MGSSPSGVTDKGDNMSENLVQKWNHLLGEIDDSKKEIIAIMLENQQKAFNENPPARLPIDLKNISYIKE